MEIEKLIEAAERCKRVIKDSDCQGCHYRYSDQCPCDVYEDVLKLKSHYESLLASERSKVIAEVRDMWQLCKEGNEEFCDVVFDFELKLYRLDKG